MRKVDFDLAYFMKSCGMTTDDVCGLVGVNRSSVYRWRKEKKVPLCAFVVLRRKDTWEAIRSYRYYLV